MTIIIGIDPGSHKTGYGVVKHQGQQSQYITCGTVNTGKGDTGQRLYKIYQALSEVVEEFTPSVAVIEQVFFHQNPSTALKLGQARGAAMVALSKYALPISEYTPREIKLAVVGYGAAKKEQVQHMVRHILNLRQNPAPDAADALAVALCHTQYQGKLAQLLKDKA